ncbi:DUF1493 family protein [Asticcacaulis sp. AC402]|uniref:DUF1493 family protein n=1 Tax=Asticcacaulis sp. AC402 TaxID=1282361 RepID=UPI0004294548|nr:DUF1493 family protein [Asticcacaulis sp. AC402]
MTAPSPELEAFVKEYGDVPPPDADLFKILGLDGDCCDEFLEAFRERFGVDMTPFLWYFHHDEEVGSRLGRLLFKAPAQRVQHIPITLNLLQQAVDAGQWPIQYPPHTLPRRRWDLWFAPLDAILFGLVVVGVILGFKWLFGLFW